MSQVVELLRARHATRSISPAPLPAPMVEDLIEAARLTPSCFNKQPWRYIFLQGEKALAMGREVLADGNRAWAGRAPLLIIAHTQAKDDCQLPDRDYHQFDLGLSVMNLMLAATEHGLVARPMAGFDPNKARELFGLDADTQPLVMLAVGKPASDEEHLPEHYRGIADKPRERKSAGQIVERL